eukprot:TRINITY_DN2897_c0_g1_i1.p1 TRINITY_DN2897_c0_g1~~TRINITY_DN2897_c0_g1_i1.p1  ORF type:complete len:126 (-),score=6.07 TRINITY_DN2897_c0_g1_i1:1-378(-)
MYTVKSDVYSMAIFVEIASRAPPYHEFDLNIFHLIIKIVQEDLRPSLQGLQFPDENFCDRYVGLVQRCWNKDPNKRLSFIEIQVVLEDILTQYGGDGEEGKNRHTKCRQAKENLMDTLTRRVLEH